jgi:hypothetical protein
LIYITVGSLVLVWSGIAYWYLSYRAQFDPIREGLWFWCYGFMLTGLILIVIGLAVGQIGRSARRAELPPPEATATVAKVDQNAAAHGATPPPNGASAVQPGPVAIAVPVAAPAPPPVTPTNPPTR